MDTSQCHQNGQPYDQSMSNEEFTVEKVLGKRERNGTMEYFIKWENFSNEFNTWEPVEHMNCPDLIAEFETKLQKDSEGNEFEKLNIEEHQEMKLDVKFEEKALIEKDEKPLELTTFQGVYDNNYKVTKGVSGFVRGLIPEKILEASRFEGKIVFLMKWCDNDICDFVYDTEAKEICPDVVIAYYQQFISWSD